MKNAPTANGKFQPGVSIVSVTKNGARRLPVMIDHVLKQKAEDKIPWEIVIINNDSTDNTLEVVHQCLSGKASYQVIDEPRQGVAYARITGILTAKYEYILFVDDDNWIAPDWVEKIFNRFQTHPDIGMMGGKNTGVFETPPPEWLIPLLGSLAIGGQGMESSDITESRGYVWGAGMALRKSVFHSLLEKGFKPLLTGRKDGKMTPGEDTEIAYLYTAAGYRIWYFSDLTLQHDIPSYRLKLDYIIKLYEGIGESGFILESYRLISRNTRFTFQYIFFSFFAETIYRGFIYAFTLFNRKYRLLNYVLFRASLSKFLNLILNIKMNKLQIIHIRNFLHNIKN